MTHDNSSDAKQPIPGASDAVPTPPTTKPFDPFDVSRLTISQDFISSAGVNKPLTTVPVRKPAKEWFIRTHPDAKYRLTTYFIELKEESELYLVDPSLWEALATESTFGPKLLITSINRQNVQFLWPLRLPDADGRIDAWSRSALDASQRAMNSWVRMQSNRSLGAYEIYEATGHCGDPKWNIPPMGDLLRIAFKDKFIDSEDHPVLRRLRGEA